MLNLTYFFKLIKVTVCKLFKTVSSEFSSTSLYMLRCKCSWLSEKSQEYVLSIKTRPPSLSVGFIIMFLFIISFCKVSCSSFGMLELNDLYSVSIFSVDLTKCCNFKSFLLNCLLDVF